MTNDTRPSRQILHMQTAWSWSKRSLCKRLQVGCVLTNPNMDEILAFGYNGPGKGLRHDRCRFNEAGNCGCLHAEDNAIAGCKREMTNGVAFITATPCEYCAQRLLRAGVKIVYYAESYRDSTGFNILVDSDVELVYLPLKLVIESLNSLIPPQPLFPSSPPMTIQELQKTLGEMWKADILQMRPEEILKKVKGNSVDGQFQDLRET